jgi:hypothetical protein
MFRALELKTVSGDCVEVRADGVALFDAGGEPLYFGKIEISEQVDIDPESSPHAPNSWGDVFVVGAKGKTPALRVCAAEGAPDLPKGYTHALRVGSVRFGTDRRLWETLQHGNEASILEGPDRLRWDNYDGGDSYNVFSPEMSRVDLVGHVPPTASAVNVTAVTNHLGKRYGNIMVSGSRRESGTDRGPLGKFGYLPKIWLNGERFPGSSYDPYPQLTTAWIPLETREVFCSVSTGGASLRVNGWRDNL